VRLVRIGAGAFLILVIAMFLGRAYIPSVNHRLHWMVYGYDRVWYHNRTYIGPYSATLRNVQSKLGTLYPTGEKVIGLPVLDTKAALQSIHTTVPTLLILENNTTCTVYELSGGP